MHLFPEKFLQIKYTLHINYYRAGRKYTPREQSRLSEKAGRCKSILFPHHTAIDLLEATAEC